MFKMAEPFIEPTSVPDVFVTELAYVEMLGNGLTRNWLSVKEEGISVIKVRLIIPLSCALNMNSEAACAYGDEYRRLYPLKVVR